MEIGSAFNCPRCNMAWFFLDLTLEQASAERRDLCPRCKTRGIGHDYEPFVVAPVVAKQKGLLRRVLKWLEAKVTFWN